MNRLIFLLCKKHCKLSPVELTISFPVTSLHSLVPNLRITVGNLDSASTKFHLVGGSNPASLGQEERRSKISLTTPIIGERRGRVRD